MRGQRNAHQVTQEPVIHENKTFPYYQGSL